MYSIIFSEKVIFKIDYFVDSYRDSFLKRFLDTWIYNEDWIRSSYIELSKSFRNNIYYEINNKLKEELVLWRMLSEKEFSSVFIIVWNYRILIDYKENTEIRIIQEINFYKK